MDDKKLRYTLTIAFTSEEKCPVCENTIEINVESSIERNKLLGTIKDYFGRSQREHFKIYYFKEVRTSFWMLFLAMITFYIISFLFPLLTDFNINIFHILSIYWGLMYLIAAGVYYIKQKMMDKKNLKMEIDEITKVM